ncbi:OmpA family protein [Pontibacter populi]|uniref:OmpA family protein n=1 Tax=Pontibacter populi TaxID=890055 RepID=A0ABV1RYF2_9BACT
MKITITSLLLGLGLLAACNNPEGSVENDSLADATKDTAVVYDDEGAQIEADGAEIVDLGEDFWASIDWEAPVSDDPNLTREGIEVRTSAAYSVYTMDDRVLFDTDKAEIRPEGETKLQTIVEKIKNLQPNSQVRIFGHADARAGNEYNKELSAQRANAVKDWLQNKGGISPDRLSIEAMGESEPRATNETAKGRQLNRRVAIVVATGQQ